LLNEIPNPDKSDFGFSSFLDRIDAIIMGKNTFEMVVSFREWPYPKPVFVLSNSLKKVPEGYEDKAEIMTGEINDILASLKNKGIETLYIDGGKTIQSFLKQDLIDELIITTVPIVLGSGIPLFSEMNPEIRFELIKTEILNKILVKSKYKRKM